MNQELKLYEVTNRNTGEKHYTIDSNAQDACLQAGWLIADCYIIEQQPIRKYDKHQRSTLLVKIPCHICSYQLTECNKPNDTDCPIQPQTSDLHQWLDEIAKSRLCHYVGHHLAPHDYQTWLKRVSLDEAIKELTPKAPPTPPNASEPTCQPTQTIL